MLKYRIHLIIIMTHRRELEQQASSFAKKLDNFLHKNTNIKIHGVALQGSRKQGTHRDDSDLDIVFAASKDPNKDEIYPELVDILTEGMNVKAELGANKNVINIRKRDLDIDLVLLSKEDFEKQIRENKIKRIDPE